MQDGSANKRKRGDVIANLNKVMLIGRLTRDPEVKMFANGGKLAKFGFAVNGRKKNSQTGQWEDDPVFLDCEAFNRGEHGKTANLVEENLRKGSQVFLEGHLKMDQWAAQDGSKRSKIVIVVDSLQFLDPRPQAQQTQRAPVRSDPDAAPADEWADPPPPATLLPASEEIPF